MKYKSVNLEPKVYERLVIAKSIMQTRLKRIITFTDTVSLLIDLFHESLKKEEKEGKEKEEKENEPKPD